jgi:hypothetical protein
MTEFYHSGSRLYTSGTVYNDITSKVAEQLIALDKKKELGALSFFAPVDEEAVNFINGKKGTKPAPTTPTVTGIPATAPKNPTRAELIQEAKNLGIKGASFMKEANLKEAIEAAKKTQPPATKGTEITELAPADGRDVPKE